MCYPPNNMAANDFGLFCCFQQHFWAFSSLVATVFVVNDCIAAKSSVVWKHQNWILLWFSVFAGICATTIYSRENGVRCVWQRKELFTWEPKCKEEKKENPFPSSNQECSSFGWHNWVNQCSKEVWKIAPSAKDSIRKAQGQKVRSDKESLSKIYGFQNDAIFVAWRENGGSFEKINVLFVCLFVGCFAASQ